MQSIYDDPNLDVEARPSRKPRLLNGTQIMFAVIIAIALMLAINFSSRVTADRELQRVRDTVQQEIAKLRMEQGQLIERLAFVQSDAFIEQWARSQGRMVREGEVLLVLFPMMAEQTEVMADSDDIVFASEPVTLIQAPAPSWHSWWALFFDAPPPGA